MFVTGKVKTIFNARRSLQKFFVVGKNVNSFSSRSNLKNNNNGFGKSSQNERKFSLEKPTVNNEEQNNNKSNNENVGYTEKQFKLIFPTDAGSKIAVEFKRGDNSTIHYRLSPNNSNRFIQERVSYHSKDVVDDGSSVIKRGVVNFFKKMLFPVGYPSSVPPDYRRYVFWNFVQGICGSASYVLSTQALLVSVGVSSGFALPASSLISWILKDGLGLFGMILLASKIGSGFDTDLKRNRWRADVLHNFGVTLELCTSLFPRYFLLLAATANLLKGLAGITLGASRAAMNKYFSLRENMGDVTAKAQSQGIGAYLIGMSVGIGLSFVTAPGAWSTFAIFGVLASCHLFTSWKALSSVHLNILNTQNSSLLMRHFFESGECPTPKEIANSERIILKPEYRIRPDISLGASLSETFEDYEDLKKIIQLCYHETFMVNVKYGRIYVALHKDVDLDPHNVQLLRCYFFAAYLRFLLQKQEAQKRSAEPPQPDAAMLPEKSVTDLISETLTYGRKNFPLFVNQLRQKNWNLEYIKFSSIGEFRSEWRAPNVNNTNEDSNSTSNSTSSSTTPNVNNINITEMPKTKPNFQQQK